MSLNLDMAMSIHMSIQRWLKTQIVKNLQVKGYGKLSTNQEGGYR